MMEKYYALFSRVAAIVTFIVSGAVATGYEQPYYSHNNGGYHGDGGDHHMSEWNMDWGAAGLQQQKCIDIPQNMSLCKNIGYTQMRIPNLLDHDTVREVTQQASSWVPLLGIRCHPDTKVFLCSLFSPVCLDRPIWPCRTLCEAVKNGCESLMLKYGFPWPEMLRCDKFPPDNDLCIGLQHDNTPAVEVPPSDDSICPVCNLPDTYEAIVDNYCSSDFVMRVKIDEHVISGSNLKIVTSRKKKRVKQGSLSKREIRSLILYVGDGATCDCPLLQNTEQNGRDSRNDKSEYIVMGSRDADKLNLQYIIQLDVSRKDMKKAWKAMKKGNLCKNGLPSLPITPGKKRKQGSKSKKSRKESSSDADLPIRNDNHNEEAIRDNDDMSNQGRDRDRPDKTGDEAKKKRKHCKNPRKCTSSVTTTAPPSSRRQDRDRTERRRTNSKRKRNPLDSVLL